MMSVFNDTSGWNKFKMFIAGLSGNFALFNKLATGTAGEAARDEALESYRQAYEAQTAALEKAAADYRKAKYELRDSLRGFTSPTSQDAQNVGVMGELPKQLQRANELTLDELTKFTNTVSVGFAQINNIILKSGQQIQTISIDIGQMIKGAIDSIIRGFQMDGLKGAVNELSKFLGESMMMLGQALVATNFGKLAFATGDPATGIAVGLGLIAAGAALSSMAQNRLSSLGSQGGFNSGAVSSSSSSMQTSINIPDTVVLRASGADLMGAIKVSSTNLGRASG